MTATTASHIVLDPNGKPPSSSFFRSELLRYYAGDLLSLGVRAQVEIWEFPITRGTLFGGPYYRDPTI